MQEMNSIFYETEKKTGLCHIDEFNEVVENEKLIITRRKPLEKTQEELHNLLMLAEVDKYAYIKEIKKELDKPEGTNYTN